MAIFKDLTEQESRIWRALRAALQEIRSASSEQQELAIIVVGSVARGTGSGMFIDMALVLRLLAQQLQIPHVLRGFFALPTVFTPTPHREMLIRSFVAWRELNRFMTATLDFPTPLIEYVESDPSFRIRLDQQLFDACYLVEGQRDGCPVVEGAYTGAFPMIAAAIGAVLEEGPEAKDPYKLTVIRADGAHQSDSSAWKDCSEAYAAEMGSEDRPSDPVLMQNFAAEARAVEYERRLACEQGGYQPLHPRVVMLLEDHVALRQFLYLYMLGVITEEESDGIHRWELRWILEDKPQTLWLTKGWIPDADRAQRPNRPDLLNAIHGYVIMRVTRQPGHRTRIDTGFAQRLIDRELKEMRAEGEFLLLCQSLGQEGIVGRLKSLAYDQDSPDQVRRDYTDLALVFQFMLKDRLNELGASRGYAEHMEQIE